MAKSPPVQTFEISCEVEVHNLGLAMVALAHIDGLTVTGSKLVTTVKSFKQNTTTPGFNTAAFVREWIADHPTFKAKEAVHAVRATGNGNGSATYHVLTKLIEAGELKKIGEGMYSRPDVKALAQPKKTKQTQTRRDIDHRTFLLRAASRNHGRFNTSWMKAQFEKDGRIPGNVSPTIAAMMEKKLLKRVGDSEYALFAKASKKPAPKKTDKPKLNGPVPVEVPANG